MISIIFFQVIFDFLLSYIYKESLKRYSSLKTFLLAFYLTRDARNDRAGVRGKRGLMVYDWRFGQWRDIRMEAASCQCEKKSRSVSFVRERTVLLSCAFKKFTLRPDNKELFHLFEINFTVSLNFIVVSILLKDVEKNIIYRFAENCLAFSPEPENTFAREVGILQF